VGSIVLRSAHVFLEIPSEWAHNAGHMSDEDFKQQVLEQFGAMDKRFDAIDRRIEAMGNQLNEIDRRLDKLETGFADLKLDTTQLKVDVRLIYRSIQTLLDQQEVETHERVRTNDVLNRHERWITGLAKRADLKLSYD
jgi:chromosome segregation ATPase